MVRTWSRARYGTGQAGRCLGEGAVAAPVAAQHGQGDEHLRREGDPVAVGLGPDPLGRPTKRGQGQLQRAIARAPARRPCGDRSSGAGVGGHRRHLTGARPPPRRPSQTTSAFAAVTRAAGKVRSAHHPAERGPPGRPRDGEDDQPGPGDGRQGQRDPVVRVVGPGVAVGHHQHGGIVLARAAEPTNSEAQWPSGPSPGGRDRRPDQWLELALIGGGGRRRVCPIGTSDDPIAPGRPGSSRASVDHPVIGVGMVGGHAPLVPQVDVHGVPGPAARAPGRASRPAAGSSARRWAHRRGRGRTRPGSGSPRHGVGDQRAKASGTEPTRSTSPSGCTAPEAHWGARSTDRRSARGRSRDCATRHPDRSTSRSAMCGPHVPAG